VYLTSFDSETTLKTVKDESLQGCFHLREGIFGLFKEIEYNTTAEVSIFLIVVHLKDLLERLHFHQPSGLEFSKLEPKIQISGLLCTKFWARLETKSVKRVNRKEHTLSSALILQSVVAQRPDFQRNLTKWIQRERENCRQRLCRIWDELKA
jgi:hypothetical protein